MGPYAGTPHTVGMLSGLTKSCGHPHWSSGYHMSYRQYQRKQVIFKTDIRFYTGSSLWSGSCHYTGSMSFGSTTSLDIP